VGGVLEWLGRVEDRPSFVTLYMESVDTEGHIYGPESSESYKVAAAVSQVDNAIRMIYIFIRSFLEFFGVYCAYMTGSIF
jgi:predicted AlkP superfamily pyrophosphatase or phosphodiesterase